jgi:N-formylglutamate amidohydrolase
MQNYVVVHVPHASGVLPQDLPGSTYLINPAEEIERVTDWYTDDLFSGYESVAFPWSRIYCDVERLIPDPLDAVGQGFAYERTLDGRRLRSLTVEDRTFVRSLYDKHHASLEGAIERAVSLMPVMIVDAHSFSAEQARLSGSALDPLDMPNVCIGHNRGTLPDKFLWGLYQHFKGAGWRVALNEPYQGSLIPDAYKAHPDVRTVMLEINKGVYLEPGTIERVQRYAAIQEVIQGALRYIEAYDFSAA